MSEIGARCGRERLIPVDILKIVFAILIFMRHDRTMGGINWYGLNDFVLNSTSLDMNGFFLLSGFALYYQYGYKSISQGKN